MIHRKHSAQRLALCEPEKVSCPAAGAVVTLLLLLLLEERGSLWSNSSQDRMAARKPFASVLSCDKTKQKKTQSKHWVVLQPFAWAGGQADSWFPRTWSVTVQTDVNLTLCVSLSPQMSSLFIKVHMHTVQIQKADKSIKKEKKVSHKSTTQESCAK